MKGAGKLNLKFNHIIHYVNQLKSFQFPGRVLTIQPGGKHPRLGTYNKLSYINENYIELLDVEDKLIQGEHYLKSLIKKLFKKQV